MSWDKVETLYHLTLTGWVAGEERYFGTVQKNPPMPENRIETWKCRETQASEWSRTYVDWTCEWVTDAVSREERDALRTRHPVPTSGGRATIGKPL
jgi:hypothetical protein